MKNLWVRLLFVCGAIVFAITLFCFSQLLNKYSIRATDRTSEPLSTFISSFIDDFGNYTYKDSHDYQNRVSKYFTSSVLPSVLSEYGPPPTEYLPARELVNYQKVLDKSFRVVPLSGNKYTVKVSLRVETLEYPDLVNITTQNLAYDLLVLQTGNQYTIEEISDSLNINDTIKQLDLKGPYNYNQTNGN